MYDIWCECFRILYKVTIIQIIIKYLISTTRGRYVPLAVPVNFRIHCNGSSFGSSRLAAAEDILHYACCENEAFISRMSVFT